MIKLHGTSGTWATGNYTLDLVVDGTPATCNLSVYNPPSSTASTCSSTLNTLGLNPVAFGQESNCVASASDGSCTPIPGQFHLALELLGTPSQVALTFSRDGHQLFSESLALHYQVSQPNGPDCGPTCHNASSDVSIGAL